MELIGADHEAPVVVGAGEIEMDGLDRLSTVLKVVRKTSGTPSLPAIDLARSLMNRWLASACLAETPMASTGAEAGQVRESTQRTRIGHSVESSRRWSPMCRAIPYLRMPAWS